MSDVTRSFSELLRDVLGDRLATADGFADMLDDDAVMEFPFAPPGLPQRLHGRQAIEDYLARLSKLLAFERMGIPTVHQTSDPEVVIFEFEGFGHGVNNGAPYEQRYISVVRTREGRIVFYQDYWNPLAIASTLNGPSVVEAVTIDGMLHE